MPREGTSNRKQNKMAFAPRSQMQVSLPPLISYIQRQFHQLGESSSRLTRWVTGRDGLASRALRAIRLPLSLRNFEHIWRKANLISPAWQRALDLPWYRRHRKGRHRSTRITGTIADRDLNISLQPDEIYPGMPFQISFNVEEGRPDYQADETYPPATSDKYPSTNDNLLSPPLTRMGVPVAGNLPPGGSAIKLPLYTRKMPDQARTIERSQPLNASIKELAQTPDAITEKPGQPPQTNIMKGRPQPPNAVARERDQTLIVTTIEPAQRPNAVMKERPQPWTAVGEQAQPPGATTRKTGQPPATSMIKEHPQPWTAVAREHAQPPGATTRELAQPLTDIIKERSLPLTAVTEEHIRPLDAATREPAQPLTTVMKERTQLLGDVTKEPAQPPTATAGEPSGRVEAETYPAVIKNLFPPPESMQRVSGITSRLTGPTSPTDKLVKRAHTSSLPLSMGQIKDCIDAGGTRIMLSQTGRNDIAIPSGVYQSRKIREHDHRQTEDTDDRMAEVNRQLQYAGPRGRLSRVLMPITRRIIKQGWQTKSYFEAKGKSISEIHASPIVYARYQKAIETEGEATSAKANQADLLVTARVPKIRVSGRQIARTIGRLPAIVSLKQRAILKSEISPHAPPDRSEPDTPGVKFKRHGSYISGVLHQSKPRLSHDRRQMTSADATVEQKERKASFLYQEQGMAELGRSSDGLHFVNLEYTTINKESPIGRMNKPLSYRELPSVAIPRVQPLAANESIHNTTTFPPEQPFKSAASAPLSTGGEKHTFPQVRGDAPPAPTSRYASQLAPEKPPAHSIHTKAERSIARSEEPSADISDFLNKLPYSRNQSAPELVLAPAGRAPAMSSSQVAREEPSEPERTETAEEVTKPDLDVIAEDVYRILKRRLSAERERALGVY